MNTLFHTHNFDREKQISLTYSNISAKMDKRSQFSLMIVLQ